MRNKLLLRTLFISILATSEVSAQSYEGYISDTLPIWLDFNEPTNDGLISGTYFYKNNGGIIGLSGSIKDTKLILQEVGKNGLITGEFNCNVFNDSLIGTWSKPKNNKVRSVRLYSVEKRYKEFSSIPPANKLLLNDGRSLNEELQDSQDESGKPPRVNYCFAERSILSTFYNWEFMGAYSSIGTTYHTFNLTNNQEIILSKELINSELKNIKENLRLNIQKKLNNHRKELDEATWLNIFGDKEAMNNAFQVKEIDIDFINNFYIKGNNINIVIDNYLQLPHAMKAADISMEFQIPFTNLKPFLNKESILNNL